jgi:hypothetical protein
MPSRATEPLCAKRKKKKDSGSYSLSPQTRDSLCWLFIFRSPSRVPYRTELIPRAPKWRRTRTPTRNPGKPNFVLPNLDSVNHCTSKEISMEIKRYLLVQWLTESIFGKFRAKRNSAFQSRFGELGSVTLKIKHQQRERVMCVCVCVCSVYYQPNSSRRGGPPSRPPTSNVCKAGVTLFFTF